MANDFLFHEISEKEREEIRKQAKSIMDSFSKKLSKVDKDIKQLKEPLIERDKGEREEDDGRCSLNLDRNIMFDNAPQTDNKKDFIIAEKKGW